MPTRRLATIIAIVFVAASGLAWASSVRALEALAEWRVDPGIAGVVAPIPQIADDALPSFAPRALITSLAKGLRDIRYRRGGREPSTGFDCSGFVRYVFQQGLDVELPASSAAQFQAGRKVDRDRLVEGDLVFLRTEGKRVSHVGIYLGDGRFIHAPSSGKRVSVSSLAERYWARRYAGAKRPEVLVGADIEDELNVRG